MLSLCHELGLESTQGCSEILSQPREAQSQAAHSQSQEQPAKMSSFSFIVCSQETPLIPESGHLSELLQPLHRMGTLCLYQHSVKKNPGKPGISQQERGTKSCLPSSHSKRFQGKPSKHKEAGSSLQGCRATCT